MKKLTFILVMVVAFIVGCSSEPIEEVNVYKMKSFSETDMDILVKYTDSKVINAFIKAFNAAHKEPGVVNMADPDYKVELGDETYFLWLEDDHGTIMNMEDTNTIYTLSKRSAGILYKTIMEK
ncbi:hypothetical protein [Mesobacillus subterraneus]|uniref:YhfM-like domain-containing protein n=1 Tax=Mesobacillus subterraneus TaxID=285983 RepID=A0A3R9F2T6_9BACI|nr:hypothetical protein [Mesobacillus subterraneus]RSD28677.1 hypothetical protein EJA10_03625 [Mesobacillus subterraneus]